MEVAIVYEVRTGGGARGRTRLHRTRVIGVELKPG